MTTAGTTVTRSEILHHTTAFISTALSQTEHQKNVISLLRRRLPNAGDAKTLTVAAEALEAAADRSSSLGTAESLIRSRPESALSSLLLSFSHALRHRHLDAALCLLDVFRLDPSAARDDVAPAVFEELFLLRLLPVIRGFDDRRTRISSSKSLSKMSSAQASELRELEREYEEVLDDNCRFLAVYLKEVLAGKDDAGDWTEGLMKSPPLSIKNRGKVKVFDLGMNSVEEEEDRSVDQEFGLSVNGRYNPIWTSRESSLEFLNDDNSTGSCQSNSLLPFYPQRVSPETFSGQKPRNRKSDSETESSLDGNSSRSAAESEAGTEERSQKMALVEYTQRQSREREQPVYDQSKRSMAPKDFVCPITSNLFDDPVTLETGQTYERKAIQEWFDRGNSTCPITRQRLNITQLPKTNYVLKRLIGSWQTESLIPTEEDNLPAKQDTPYSASPNSVITCTGVEGMVGELRLAISSLCTSEILAESESAVIRINRLWKELSEDIEIRAMLAKPSVISGFVEILFNSVDTKVLRATIFLLTELGSREKGVIQTLTQVQSDVEGIAALFKQGVSEAVVLIYQLRSYVTEMVKLDLVDSLLALIKNNESELITMCVKPKTAAVILLGEILEDSGNSLLSAFEGFVESLGSETAEERIAAIRILSKCMQEDGKCRQNIADSVKLGPVLESLVGASERERFDVILFLYELVKLNRRVLNEKILNIIKDEGSLSTMHTLLVFLQTAGEEQCPVVAGLLLQLDLLAEPRKMSIFREEAIDSLIACLRNKDHPVAQVLAAETIVSLQGRFTISGKSLTRAFLLKRAGIEKIYNNLVRIDKKNSFSGEDEEAIEEERATAKWERKMASVLAGHEFGLLFEALSEGIKNSNTELASACFVSATWLVDMLKILPDTGVRGAARVCLLKRFVSIFKSSRDTEERALSLLALSSFIQDSEGMSHLNSSLKDILKGLRELKKSTPLAVEMLKVLFDGQDSSAELWNHKQLVEVDCSESGEVLSVICFKDKIFSGHSDGTIRVWTGKGSVLHLLQEVREHTKAVTSLAVLPSTARLYSGSLDRTTRVWYISDEEIDCTQVLDMKDQVQSLVVSNNVSCFIPHGSGIKVHSSNGVSKLLNSSKYVKCLALEQGRLYCGCQDNSIQEINLATETVSTVQTGSRKLLGKSSPIHALQAHGGLLYAASSSLDGTAVKILSTSDYSTVGSLGSALEVRAMAISSELVYLGCKKGGVEIWGREKQNRIDSIQTGTNSRVLCLALDANEEVLVVGTSDGKIQAWGLS